MQHQWRGDVRQVNVVVAVRSCFRSVPQMSCTREPLGSAICSRLPENWPTETTLVEAPERELGGAIVSSLARAWGNGSA